MGTVHQLAPPTRPWQEDRVQLAELLGWMQHVGLAHTLNDALGLLERPDRFAGAREEMLRLRAEEREDRRERMRTDRDFEAEVVWRCDWRRNDPQGPPERVA